MKTPSFQTVVSREEIQAFAQALGDENPLYYDVAYARRLGYRDLLLPPTYPLTFWQNSYPQWLQKLKDISILGEQKIYYEKPITAGESLSIHIELEQVFEKQGKQGSLTFALHTLVGEIQGEVAVTAETMLIFPMSRAETGLPEIMAGTIEKKIASFDFNRAVRDDRFDLLKPVAREAKALYVQRFAEASGDDNAIHFNDEAARRAGFERRITHGMWQLGVACSLLHNQVAKQGWYAYLQARFAQPLSVGDRLTLAGKAYPIEKDHFCLWQGQDGQDSIVINGKALLKNNMGHP